MDKLEQLIVATKEITTPDKCMKLQDKCTLEKTSGDSLSWLRSRLINFASDIGYRVKFGDPLMAMPWGSAIRMKDEGTVYGICVPRHREIVIEPSTAEDFQTRTLIHELTHALGATSWDSGTDELTAESTAFLVSHAAGYNSWDFSLPYSAVNYWLDQGQFVKSDILKYTNRILKEVL